MDDALGAYLALDVLQHFERVHKGDWKKMVMSYNIGNKKDSKSLKKGVAYYDKVRYYYHQIKQCSNFKWGEIIMSNLSQAWNLYYQQLNEKVVDKSVDED